MKTNVLRTCIPDHKVFALALFGGLLLSKNIQVRIYARLMLCTAFSKNNNLLRRRMPVKICAVVEIKE
jgi:hypothetical protein